MTDQKTAADRGSVARFVTQLEHLAIRLALVDQALAA